MHKIHLLYAGAVALLLLGAACTKTVTINTNAEGSTNSAAEIANVNAEANENANENVNVSENANANIAGEHGPTINGTLRVDNPQNNKKLESPFEVEGKSDASVVYVRVKNAGGVALFTESVKVRGGEFHVNLIYALTNTATGTVEVFEKDAPGDEINLVSIPVTFRVKNENEKAADTTVSGNENYDANENANENENENDNVND